MDSIQNRRTIRRYTDRPVSDALLHQLLEEAERTQTMGNLQLYSVVITRSEEMKQQLAPCHFNQPMVTTAPVVLTFCADFHLTSEWCHHRMAEPGYDNLLSFINAASDALLYCQTFCTLAEAAGLGLCYLGTTVYNPEKIIEILNLPHLVGPTKCRNNRNVCHSVPSSTTNDTHRPRPKALIAIILPKRLCP